MKTLKVDGSQYLAELEALGLGWEFGYGLVDCCPVSEWSRCDGECLAGIDATLAALDAMGGAL
jgi:hypothetical protein